LLALAPPEAYPEKRTLYSGVEDTRSCAPCECGPPEDSTCTALVSTYEDRSCMTLLGSGTLTLAGPKCIGGPGMQLASMEAEWVTNEPRSCAPRGGETTGQITPVSPSFFCCQQPQHDDLR
jgi:hypothetical protein